ncbi:uncharacterized protein LOC120001223 [Tripterygium wilfordii]|uniref:uncharacterized protein LOC120001223 n=1 Tax=Tripterygium wilfordii TaxID=458696 RepID=UPI0018F810AD|nr:uncharacterized protein LOC120001223 [Tripterygium wilfordii]
MVLAVRSKKEVPVVELEKPESMMLHGPSLASVESLSMPLVQEVVLSADIRCVQCQNRVAEIMSRMKETDSVSVNVLEKKVTIICRYPAALYKKPVGKAAMVKRIFRSSHS